MAVSTLFKAANEEFKRKNYSKAISIYAEIQRRGITNYATMDILRCQRYAKRLDDESKISYRPKCVYYGSINTDKINLLHNLLSAYQGFDLLLIDEANPYEVSCITRESENNTNIQPVSTQLEIETKKDNITDEEYAIAVDFYRQIPKGRIPFYDKLNDSLTLNSDFQEQYSHLLHQILSLIIPFKPDIVLIWHHLKPFNRLLTRYLRMNGLRVVFLHEGFLPGSISFDEHGMMAESDITSVNPLLSDYTNDELLRAAYICGELLRKSYSRKQLSLDQLNKSKAYLSQTGLPHSINIPECKPTILVLGSNDIEASIECTNAENFQIHSPMGHNSFTMLENVCKFALANNLSVAYKPHPSLLNHGNISNRLTIYMDLLREYASVLTLYPYADLSDLLTKSLVTVTLVSSSAYNALFHENPVVLYGVTPLSNKNICYQIDSYSSSHECLAEAISTGLTPIQYSNFILHIAQLISSNHYFSEYSPCFSKSGKQVIPSYGKFMYHESLYLPNLFHQYGLHEKYTTSVTSTCPELTLLKINIFCTFPPQKYSGGRYHAFSFALALAAIGAQIRIFTNHPPIYLSDFEGNDAIHNIEIVKVGSNALSDKILKKYSADISVIFPTSSVNATIKNLIDTLSRLKVFNPKMKTCFVEFESENFWIKHNTMQAVGHQRDWSAWDMMSVLSDVIISTTKYGLSLAKHSYPLSVNPWFTYIPCPIAKRYSTFDTVPPSQRRILAFVREALPHKGLSAILSLLSPSLANYKLTLVGSLSDKTNQRIIDLCSKFNIEYEHILNCSEQKKWTLYYQSYCLLYPSIFEGFGLPPLEAEACGVPVVARPIPTLLEILSPHTFFADDCSDEAFARAFENFQCSYPSQPRFDPVHKSIVDFPNFTIFIASRFYSFIHLERSLPIAATARKKYSILLWPPISSDYEVCSHFHRCRWYLKKSSLAISAKFDVNIPTTSKTKFPLIKGNPPYPDYISKNSVPASIKIIKVEDDSHLTFLENFLRSNPNAIILKGQSFSEDFQLTFKNFPPYRVYDVETERVGSKEYANYTRVHWDSISRSDKDTLLLASRRRFGVFASNHVANDISYVFCTGPSIDSYSDFSFESSLRIGCNTTILNDELYRGLGLHILTAGDVVSHFGVSAYAQEFRTILRRRILEDGLYFFTTAMFGYHILLESPELSDNIIFAEQGVDGPVTNLFDTWLLPKLSSTLNIHMLPIAATLTSKIYLLGVDGQSNDETKNEDFWAHSSSAQMHSLVNTGHIAHPTFAIDRDYDSSKKVKEIERFDSSCSASFSAGMKLGKQYIVLNDTYTQSMKPFVVNK
jgi:glycosyltransferase involved in cell wall biosynthesis